MLKYRKHECGMEMEFYSDSTRDIIKRLREYMVLAKLWNCKPCQRFIKGKLKHFKEVA